MLPTHDPITSLRIAVTGHRDLDPGQDTELRGAVHDAIESLVERCRPARVELLTGMADGADQLVADVAADLGCALHVVLPKQHDEYRAELSDDGARRLDLLGSGSAVAVSTIVDGRPDDRDDIDPSLPYHRLGLYLAKASHVLIALWDGRLERKPGGTLDVLTSYLDRSYAADPVALPPSSISVGEPTADLTGPAAIWVETARAGDSPGEVTATKYLVASGLPGVWRTMDQMPVCLERMLDDLAVTASVTSGTIGQGEGYPLLDPIPTDVESGRQAALHELHDAYMAADRLALFHQSRSDRSSIGAGLLAAAMGFAFLWFAKIDDHVAWLYGYLALFAAGYALFRTARSRHWLGHHLSFRMLAETLRVRFFTTLLGVADRVDIRRVLALTGVSSFPGFGWAAEADRLGVSTTQHLPPQIDSQNELVRAEWVDDQARYFERKVEQLHARHERLELIQRLLYVLSFLTVVVIIVYGGDLKKVYAPGDVSLKTILIFLMGLLPLWLTLWELHQGRMATRELLWQFRNQASIFRRASDQLHESDTSEARTRIYIELAERSLFETYLWTIQRFHREFTPPSGG